MPSYPILPLRSRFTTTLDTFVHDPNSLFDQALSEDLIQQIADDENLHFADGEEDVYTPAITLWAFLAQVLSGCKSCVAAVARVMILLIGDIYLSSLATVIFPHRPPDVLSLGLIQTTRRQISLIPRSHHPTQPRGPGGAEGTGAQRR